MDPDIFDKALEKLWIHGGAVLDFAENVSRGQDSWRESYIAHGEQKRAQIDQMIRYAESNQCRMSHAGASLRRPRRRTEGVRHLRFLRRRAVRRATVPDGHGGGADGAIPCRRRDCAPAV